MGHTDVVTVDASKWTFPPFSATRDGGYVYGRGTIDDKDNLAAGLMTMLLLKRKNVPLDRDVIFLAESGEEGNSNFGIQFMVAQHFDQIDAEYCFAEGGGVTRIGGQPRFATVQATEKIPRGIELVAHGISGHGSIPLKSNAIVHLAGAVARVAEWRPEVRFNETTGSYFRGLAAISAPDVAATIGTSCPPTRRSAPPPTTGSSNTSRSIRRCCEPRCRRTSSPAAIAPT